VYASCTQWSAGRPGAGRPGRAGGFTLIEVLVVLMLTGIAIAAALALLSGSMWGENYLQRRTIASMIATSRVEGLRALPFSDLPDMVEDRVEVNAAGDLDADGGYFRSTTVEDGDYATRLVTVQINSGWRPERPELELTVSTVLMDHDGVE